MSRTTTRRTIASPSRVESGVDATFVDAFLRRWVESQLGRTERRAVIQLSIQTLRPAHRSPDGPVPCADGVQLTDIANLIAVESGLVIETDERRIVAVWGAVQSDAGDCRRALEAAFAIAKHSGNAVRVLLDVRFALVAKDAPDEISMEFGVDDAAWEFAVTALPEGVVLTRAFRKLAGIERGLLALSMGRVNVATNDAILYALPTGTGADLDKFFGGSVDLSQQALDSASPGYMAQLNRLDGLGDLKAVIVIAAIAGMTFSAGVLARMLGIDEARLAGALNHAETLQLIKPSAIPVSRPSARSPTYSFLDSALQRVAYGLVAKDDRRRLHAKAADALASLQSTDGAIAEQVAAHHEHAANRRQSKRWLGKAAWDAIAQGDTTKAIKYLEAALADAPEGGGSQHSKHHLLQLLGIQIALARGNASEQFFEIYQRSLETASNSSQGQRSGSEFRALWGLQSYHLVRGEIRAALTIGRLLMTRFVETNRDEGADCSRSTNHYKLLIHRMHGLAVMLNGQLDEAERHYDAVLDIYEMDRDASLRFSFGSDQAALALAHRCWTRTLRGDGVGAKEDAIRARRQAERLAHAHTSVHVLGVLALAALQCRSRTEAALAARETRAIAVEKNFPYWIAWSDVVLAASQSDPTGDPMRTMAAACARYEAQDAQQLLPVAYCALGEAGLAAGRLDEAHKAIETGLGFTRRGGVIVQQPRLKLVQSRILRALGDESGAAASWEDAYGGSKASGATLFLRQVTLDGCIHSGGQEQIMWQRRYHAAL